MQKWTVAGDGKAENHAFSLRVKQMMAEYDCGSLLASLLVHRGYDVDTAADLMSEDLIFDDPFTLKDMDLAVERINRALDDYERIVIYGDYDCDGVTASVLLYTFLSTLGADVEIRLPHRQKDGYGLHEPAIIKMAEDGVNLIITVDNGISAIKEAELIAELGMDLVITDHHLPGDTLPKAVAVVDPHRADCESRFKDLAGCGVALKLVAAMQDGDAVTALESFAALAAIGTVGDIMPMTDENRHIVRFGMQMIENNELPGLQALLDVAGIKGSEISSKDIGFGIVPRINAAGRIDDAMNAVRLLLCEDYEQAKNLALRLHEANAARQQLEHQINDAIKLQFAKNPNDLWQRVIVAAGEEWHAGVIGICAARLVEQYGKPSFVISIDPKSGMAHGSARGFSSFSIYDALDATKQYLSSYGGHEGAGGFSLKAEDLPKWKEALFAYCAKAFDTMPVYELYADMTLSPGMLSCDAVEELSRLEPFGSKPTGEKNKPPVFVLKNGILQQIYPLSGGKHTKLRVTFGEEMADILLFGTPVSAFVYPIGASLDFMVSASVNSYQGEKRLSLRGIDYRSSFLSQDKFFAAKAYYEKLRRKEPITDERILLRMAPAREEIGLVYKALKQREVWACSSESLFPALVSQREINYCKFCLCIDVLSELELIRIDRRTGFIHLPKAAVKVDLNDSALYTYFQHKLQKNAEKQS